MIFTPIDKLQVEGKDITLGMGYDLIIDFGGDLNEIKRTVLKLCSPFAKIITTCDNLQIDPPESKVIQSSSLSIIFTNKQTMLKSGMMDGSLMNIFKDVIERHHSGELKGLKPYNVL
jgi:hypothetical protein